MNSWGSEYFLIQVSVSWSYRWWSIAIGFCECCFDTEFVSVHKLLNTESLCGVSNVTLSRWSGMCGLAFHVVYGMALLLQTDSKWWSFRIVHTYGHMLDIRFVGGEQVHFSHDPFSHNRDRVPFLLALTFCRNCSLSDACLGDVKQNVFLIPLPQWIVWPLLRSYPGSYMYHREGQVVYRHRQCLLLVHHV